jgi:DNA-binding MarR family transcriptional regulator
MAQNVDQPLRRMQWDYYMLTQRIARIMEQRLLNRFREAGYRDMSIARLHTLSIILQERKPTTAQRVAEVMGLSAVTVGRFVRALEEGGWVARRDDPSDGRAYIVEPTEKARAHLHEFLSISDELMDQAYQGIEAAEIERWIGHLERIVTTLSTEQEPSDEAWGPK